MTDKSTEKPRAEYPGDGSASGLSPQDFNSGAEVKWCPGCGDYAVLKALKAALAQIGTPPERVVCVSGIGCSSRLPYYLAVHGFHTVHGRAITVASGVRSASYDRDLDVWCVTGDGDALSIGAHHLVHALRRDLNLQILLLNNQIYGLTKGQVSPTSKAGTVTPTTPFGSSAAPLNVGELALASGASFFARVVDVDVRAASEIMCQARDHPGTALVEIIQNCPIYNDAAYRDVVGRTVVCRENRPLLFDDGKKGLAFDPESYGLIPAAADDPRVVVHRPTDPGLARLLARLVDPSPVGLLYRRKTEESDKTKTGTAPPIPGLSDVLRTIEEDSWSER